VLDLGTGSGAILLTLLAVARANAEALGVAERCQWRQANWFDGLTGRFDLIVSNPPYLAAAEMAGLAPETRDWEPVRALLGGADGLDAYRAIAAGAAAHLSIGGRLLLEIGPTQRAAVAALLGTAGFAEIECRSDFDARDRVITARWQGER
jgi:release factor glutamine methyltransferase